MAPLVAILSYIWLITGQIFFSIGVIDLYLCNECLEHKEEQEECFTQMFS